MKEVRTYKCKFCKKIYENKSTCSSHEQRCYFNPKTQSCAACAYYVGIESMERNGTHIKFKACSQNHSIEKELKTNCLDFAPKNSMTNAINSLVAMVNFDIKKATNAAMDLRKQRK